MFSDIGDLIIIDISPSIKIYLFPSQALTKKKKFNYYSFRIMIDFSKIMNYWQNMLKNKKIPFWRRMRILGESNFWFTDTEKAYGPDGELSGHIKFSTHKIKN